MADPAQQAEMASPEPLFDRESTEGLAKFQCGICFCPVRQSVRCTNRHLFCRDCVDRWKASRENWRPLTDEQRAAVTSAATRSSSNSGGSSSSSIDSTSVNYDNSLAAPTSVQDVVTSDSSVIASADLVELTPTSSERTGTDDGHNVDAELTMADLGLTWKEFATAPLIKRIESSEGEVSKAAEQASKMVRDCILRTAEHSGAPKFGEVQNNEEVRTATEESVDASGRAISGAELAEFEALVDFFDALGRSQTLMKTTISTQRRAVGDHVRKNMERLIQCALPLLTAEISGRQWTTDAVEENTEEDLYYNEEAEEAVYRATLEVMVKAINALSLSVDAYSDADEVDGWSSLVDTFRGLHWKASRVAEMIRGSQSDDEVDHEGARRVIEVCRNQGELLRSTVLQLNEKLDVCTKRRAELMKELLEELDRAAVESVVKMWSFRLRMEQVLELRSGRLIVGCPMCRQRCDFEPCPDVDRAVSELPVSCPFVDVTAGTCHWTGRYSDYCQHKHLFADQQRAAAAETIGVAGPPDTEMEMSVGESRKRRHEEDTDDEQLRSSEKKMKL